MSERSEGSQAPGAFIETSPDLSGGVALQGKAEGSPDLGSLVEQNIGWVRGWVRGHVKDPEIVHDVCQDSFLKALRSARFLKDPTRFSGWLFRIVQNTLRDHLRRKARRRRWFFSSDALGEIEGGHRGDRVVADSEEAEKLLEAVRGLPPRYRDPLLLLHAQELSYKEIGAILGLSENAVQVRVFRARKMLREKTQKWMGP